MQLPIPSIPTDNLYKFIAIAGLIGVLACLLYPPLITSSLTRKAADVAAARALIEATMEDVESRIDDVSAQVREAETKRSNVPKSEIAALEQQLGALGKQAQALQNELTRFERDGRIALAEGEALAAQMNLISLAFLPFFILTACGFLLWYLRIQRYADAILRLQAESMMRPTNQNIE